MKGPRLPFPSRDLMLIRWPLLTLLVGVLVAVVAATWIEDLHQRTTTELNNAQRELRETRRSVDQIETEEATLRRYIDRFEQLSQRGVVSAEDRLGLLETVARVREQYHLFPVNISIGEQSRMQVEYPPDEAEPGGPVELRYSVVELSLPLLHEEDLLRLLASLQEAPGLFQISSCQLRRAGVERQYHYLAQHFNADCDLFWYTFSRSPEPAGGAQ